jgi:hypothetical protein
MSAFVIRIEVPGTEIEDISVVSIEGRWNIVIIGNDFDDRPQDSKSRRPDDEEKH